MGFGYLVDYTAPVRIFLGTLFSAIPRPFVILGVASFGVVLVVSLLRTVISL